jgi:hypothetical protein
VVDAEPVQPNPGQSSPPRSELPQQQIDEQFDRVYEKLFNKKRPVRGERDSHDAANPFTQDWRERLFDIMFSNAGNLFMMTVVASLFFQIMREQGEHKEYKRLTTARLDDAQHALRVCQAQVHQAADARRQELASALERTNTAVPPEEVKRLVDQLLTSLVADIDASLTTDESKATTQTEASSDSALVDTNTPATSSTAVATTAEGHQGTCVTHLHRACSCETIMTNLFIHSWLPQGGVSRLHGRHTQNILHIFQRSWVERELHLLNNALISTQEMKFKSTRGGSEVLTFEEAVLRGYAPDGGMIVPATIPCIERDTLRQWATRNLTFPQLCEEIFALFIDEEEMPRADLRALLQSCFGEFTDDEIVPIKHLAPRHATEAGSGFEFDVAELFHGPTLAFKDLGLQFIGHMFEYLVRKRQRKLSIIVATSGDTGTLHTRDQLTPRPNAHTQH